MSVDSELANGCPLFCALHHWTLHRSFSTPMSCTWDSADTSLALGPGQHVHHKTYEHVLVLRIGLGHEQGQGGETRIIDDRFAVAEQPAVAV